MIHHANSTRVPLHEMDTLALLIPTLQLYFYITRDSESQKSSEERTSPKTPELRENFPARRRKRDCVRKGNLDSRAKFTCEGKCGEPGNRAV